MRCPLTGTTGWWTAVGTRHPPSIGQLWGGVGPYSDASTLDDAGHVAMRMPAMYVGAQLCTAWVIWCNSCTRLPIRL
ncbi:hypothetical protein HaLaN_02912, partial [Haematococcus lacustris]